jgi:hypothetical protein
MLVSRPEIFCWIFEGRRPRSASLLVGGMLRSVTNRRMSSGRSRKTSSSRRALFSPGRLPMVVVSARPTRTPWRRECSSSARTVGSIWGRPASRAVFAAWIRPCRALVIWPGQTLSG